MGKKSLLRKPSSGRELGNTDKEGGGGGDDILVELSQGFHQKLKKKSVLETEEMEQLVKTCLTSIRTRVQISKIHLEIWA